MDQFSPAAWDDLITDRLLPRRRRQREAQNEVRKRVAALKAHSGCDRFPTDLDAMARATGISDIRLVPLSMRGRIVREGSQIVAELNNSLSRRQRRFVLAHEIAHLLLARDLQNTGPQNVFGSTETRRSYTAVEQLCDFAAREMLVPENAVRRELRHRQLSLDCAFALADEADCDVCVVAECICDLPGWRDLLFLFCGRNGDGLDVKAAIPHSSTVFEVVSDSNSVVSLAQQSPTALAGTQELWANGNRINAKAEARWIDDDNAVLLVGSRAQQ